MRSFTAGLWVLCAAGLTLRAAGPTPPAILLYGRPYVELDAWARANALRLDWDHHSRDARATNRSTRLGFTVDSREVQFNGVNVWLSVPITPSNGRLLVAVLDVKSALQPLLEPARNKPGQKVHVIALDPGHGGRQPGNQDGDHLEKEYTLLLAQKVRSLLQNAGFRVVMTRTADAFVDLPERPALARRQRADLFVSLHYNATGAGEAEANGVEVYCLTPAGAFSTNAQGDDGSSTQAEPGNLNNARNLLLAYRLQKALVGNLAVKDRGVRRARFAVLKPATMPAVLIEGGFMSSPTEAQQIYNTTHRAETARAIVDGILAYKRLVER
ncbi:MAG: N-acetylmuramoyl-L-alanine amidase [Verrucomicrobiota bacterium]|jgi:N-acetylmuramoyl-L-alanine amidase